MCCRSIVQIEVATAIILLGLMFYFNWGKLEDRHYIAAAYLGLVLTFPLCTLFTSRKKALPPLSM